MQIDELKRELMSAEEALAPDSDDELSRMQRALVPEGRARWSDSEADRRRREGERHEALRREHELRLDAEREAERLHESQRRRDEWEGKRRSARELEELQRREALACQAEVDRLRAERANEEARKQDEARKHEVEQSAAVDTAVASAARRPGLTEYLVATKTAKKFGVSTGTDANVTVQLVGSNRVTCACALCSVRSLHPAAWHRASLAWLVVAAKRFRFRSLRHTRTSSRRATPTCSVYLQPPVRVM